ncbi:MAG: hypothetical protein F6J87_20785 [Spirulina sp. SIO3F2]|nr:hypothetical protein [Spirulina sp. SIO3F2]
MTKKSPSFFSLSVKPWGLFMAGGVLASVGTVFGFLGCFSWFLDLFSHFRVQYLLGLLVLGVLLLVRRRRRTATVFLILALVNLAIVLPLYFGQPHKPTESSPILRAMLVNVNTRLGDASRLRSVVSDADPDILVLEEINSVWISDLAWLTNSYPHSLAQPREDNFGIGLFSKLPLAGAEVLYIGDAGVPSILATARTEQTNLSVIATHPPPPFGPEYSRWRNDQLEKLPDYVRSLLPTLLLGDLNVTPWSYHFRRLLAQTGLHDSAKGYGVQPTWPSYNPLLRIPIDHCLHSEDIVVVDRKIGESVSSDHYPVIVDFMIEENGEGPTR